VGTLLLGGKTSPVFYGVTKYGLNKNFLQSKLKKKILIEVLKFMI